MKIGIDRSGQDIIPCREKLDLKENRHSTTDGYPWGWIEGCTKNIVWGDDGHFNKKRARSLVNQWNYLNNV